ncbi:MAG: hypothetical protein CMF46_05440 [Legionellales bacterium]|mgnify:CR=1 FL=1|nr:hypothetical protein [Legionellales bacterium]
MLKFISLAALLVLISQNLFADLLTLTHNHDANARSDLTYQLLSPEITESIHMRLLVLADEPDYPMVHTRLHQAFKHNDIEHSLNKIGIFCHMDTTNYLPVLDLIIPNHNSTIQAASSIIQSALININTATFNATQPTSIQQLIQNHGYHRYPTEKPRSIVLNQSNVKLLLSGSISVNSVDRLTQALENALPPGDESEHSPNTRHRLKDIITLNAIDSNQVIVHKTLTDDIDILLWLLTQPNLSERGLISPTLTPWPQQPSLKLSFETKHHSLPDMLNHVQHHLINSQPEQYATAERQRHLCENLPNILRIGHRSPLNALTFILVNNKPLNYFDHLHDQLCTITQQDIQKHLPNFLNPTSFSYIILRPKNDTL